MRKQTPVARILVLLLVWLITIFPVHSQELVSSAAENSRVPQARSLRLVRISVAADSSVAITANVPIDDAVSYRSGEKFVVVIPQAVLAGASSDMVSREFSSFQIDQRGDDLAVSFKLKLGTVARLEQRGAGVSVVFSSSSISRNMVPVSEVRPGTPTLDASSNVNGNGNGNGVTHAPSMPLPASASIVATSAPVPQGTPAPDLASILNSLFPGASNNVTANTTNVELTDPESAAFAVLGLTPNTVLRPASPKDFAWSLLNGLDQNGNFQSGLAIDTAPYMLFNGENVTIRDYNEHYLTRFLSRTQFSFATAKGGSQDDTSTRLSAGLNLTLWDRGDARIYHPERGDDDVLQCFANNLQLPPPIAPNTAPDVIAQINAGNKAANDTVADQCRDRARKANWNRSSWTIAYAPSWISKTGQTTGFRWNGGAFWTSLAYGFEGISSLERIGQLIFHARYRTREVVPDPVNQGQFITQNSAYFGTRFRAGGTKFALNFEDSLIRTSVINGGRDLINRFSIGAEARITNNLYFVITSGSNTGVDNGGNRGFLMSSFKYGFNKKSQFNPQP